MFALLVVLGVAAATLVWLAAGDAGDGGNGVTSRAWSFSADQERVADEFGLPNTFTIVYGEDAEEVVTAAAGDPPTHRFEYWDYYEMGTRFVFRDGDVVATHAIEPLGYEFDYPAISPESFSAGMTVEDVSELMGFEPAASADLVPSAVTGVEMYVWDGVLSVTFHEGGLISAETAPVIVEEGL